VARTFVTAVAAGLIGCITLAGTPADAAQESKEPIQVSASPDTTPESGALGALPGEEEEEAPESAVSSPPMEMDDPGTPGPNGIEVNFVGTLSRFGEGRGSESLLDANYGIGERLQLKFERPYVTEGVVGETSQKGLGATEIGVKWRFWDSNGLEVAVYPQYTFDDGFALKDEEGVEEPTEGRSTYLPLLISEHLGRNYTVAANLGYGHNFDYSDEDNYVVALGAGRAVGESGRVLVELFMDRDDQFHKRQTDARIGYAMTLFGKGRFELPAFASLGTSLGDTPEGTSEVSFVFGISFIGLPKGK